MTRRRQSLLGLGALLALLALYVVGCPSPIDAVAVEEPPARPFTGPLAPNEALRAAELFAEGVLAPETVVVDARGRMYGGCADGRIVRLAAGGAPETFATTGGRPLGLAFDGGGQLIVADARKGLLAIAADGTVRTLATDAGGVPFRFTDDVDVARDGRIYFSDASAKFGYGDHVLDLLESRGHGRLLRYDPKSRATEVLLDGLRFANGVALSHDERFVAVVETGAFRVMRYWLSGPKAGGADVLVDELPGFPDGIGGNHRGTFWIALFTVRNPQARALAPHPSLKNIVAKLPRALWPKPAPYGLVVAIDEEGRIQASLHDPGGARISNVTAAEEHNGHLYLGSLTSPFIARVPLPALPEASEL